MSNNIATNEIVEMCGFSYENCSGNAFLFLFGLHCLHKLQNKSHFYVALNKLKQIKTFHILSCENFNWTSP